MRMIPSRANSKLTFTEQLVFERMAALDWKPASACLSSLNLSQHEYKRWGEADLVLVDDAGILVIEVKGGAVSCHEGVWRYESMRHGPIERLESPVAQASGAFHSIRKFVEERLGGTIHSDRGGFCVIFASMLRRQLESITGTPELPAEICGSAEDLASSSALGNFLVRVQRYWQLKGRAHPDRKWSADDCGRVIQSLRPSFDRVPPLGLRVAEIRHERLQLTEEQYYVLDRMDECDRLLVTASAGCGKTFLAIESARREGARGAKVLFVTGSVRLAQYLQRAHAATGVRVCAYDELDGERVESHDVLIVDEGQQITTRGHLDVLDRWLASGLEGGRWRWFADPNRQIAADSRFDRESMELLRMIANKEVPLLHNCRNTAQVVTWAEQVSGVQVGRPMVHGRGPDVRLIRGANSVQVAHDVAESIEKWQRADVRPSDIVVLHDVAESLAIIEAAARMRALNLVSWSRCFAERDHVPPDWLAASPIEDFRGLEAEHVLVCLTRVPADVAELRSALYLAATRATYSVVICALAGVEELIKSQVEEGFRRALTPLRPRGT